MCALRIGYVNGPRLRRTLLAACDYAQRQRGELNRINVFPVPDGDTGTNLALTLRAIADHLGGLRDDSVGVVAREAAQAAVLGARGNCGMMLSHFLLGFAEEVEDRTRIGAHDFRDALGRGVETLHAALERPVEGTILTVMRESAEAAREKEGPDFVPLVEHVVERARDALARTPELLPVLRRAGVVDAGAKAWVSILEGALLFIHGDPIVSPDGGGWSAESTAWKAGAPAAVKAGDRSAVEAAADSASSDDVGSPVAETEYGEDERYRFCTEALVRGGDLPPQARVRERLRSEGDSLIVIRSGDVLKVHIHTDDPEAVFAYLRSLGRLATHKAEDMRLQQEAAERAGSGAGGHPRTIRRPVAVVTDSAADLPEEVVRAHGIEVTPLVLVDDDRSYRDGVDMTATDFHRLLEDDGERLPTTSQPAPADFLAAYRRAAESGEEILAVVLGSSLSGTFGSAEAAAKRFDEAPVHLVDSLGASLLVGLLALKGAELGELGRPPREIVRELGRIRGQSGILFTVDTFDRLLASGRVGRGRALLGSVLGVKPILGLTRDGVVEPVDKVLGRRRVRPAMIAALETRIPENVQAVRFGVVHVGAPEIVDPVVEALRDRWGEHTEILTAPATPVISTHLGIGAWGVAYMVEDGE